MECNLRKNLKTYAMKKKKLNKIYNRCGKIKAETNNKKIEN